MFLSHPFGAVICSLKSAQEPVPVKKQRRYNCKFCGFSSTDKETMGAHYDTKHRDLIPGNTDGYRYFYFLLTRKENGSCVICHKQTEFNRTTMKYSRFCPNPKCKQIYREQFKTRMIGTYGRVHLLNDPEVQKAMLAARRISGKYLWSDGVTKLGYTGSYELHFLKFLDTELHWSVDDIMAPSPHVYKYDHDGVDRFYIPDFFIPSLSLEIEIKDNGSAKNISDVSREKDKLKDELMRSNENYFNYMKLVNKEYSEFLKLVKEV